MSILVVGSIAFDSVETPFGVCERALGGAANFFSMTASLFTKVHLVGVVGEDFPRDHLNFLEDRGVDIGGVLQALGKTFHWKGYYGYDLNEAQTLKTELNVFQDFDPKLSAKHQEAQTVFLANIDPSLQLDVLYQVKEPKITAMDTMNFWIESKNLELKEVVSKINILFINEAELRQLAGERNTYKAARQIQDLGPKTIVVKRGEYGALLCHESKHYFVPAYPLEDLYDPTGAGDTFAAGFMGYLDRAGDFSYKTLKEAMVMG
ncbi:MAG: sugar kinase, partial [Deltaproteobacteria bacterium]|nr:sugar kinase [Deltaproteobacteria bacterium]